MQSLLSLPSTPFADDLEVPAICVPPPGSRLSGRIEEKKDTVL